MEFPTLEEELRVDYFEKSITEMGFEKAAEIRHNGHTIKNCSGTTLNALSLPCFNFLYDCKGDFVQNIWVSISLIVSNDNFRKISQALFELGERFGFVLVNWNTLSIIDLMDKRQIEEYLMGYWK